MTIYSLTETTGDAGCYGVFSSEKKATNAALKFIKEWAYSDAEETIWDGFHKCIYYGDTGRFEIWKHELDVAP